MLNSRDVSLLRPDVAANCRTWLERCRPISLAISAARRKKAGSSYSCPFTFLQKSQASPALSLWKVGVRPFLAALTDAQAYELLEKAQRHAAALPAPNWAKEELAQAVGTGITDGKEPMALVTRCQAAIMAKRAAERYPWSTLIRMANGSSRTGTAWPPRSGPAAQFKGVSKMVKQEYMALEMPKNSRLERGGTAVDSGPAA